ncbi:MAG: hypothetical protein KAT48_10265 [Bacteroidales bacterium]|nr:hypothetical protein [Bacteroidales bacterium]
MKQTKRISLMLISVLLLIACSSTKNLSDTNSNAIDGSSFEKAIIVKSVKAEYEWLADNYPGYKMKMQALTKHKNKHYDILSIETADGVEKDVYFDISRFYGRF